MKPSSLEDLENIRRMAERGRDYSLEEKEHDYVDMFQHILDNVNWIKSNEKV